MADTMPRKLPKNVYAERDRHGKVRFYYRKGKGKRTALPDPRSEAFEDAYEAARQQRRSVSVTTAENGTLAFLIQQYRESAQWALLKPSTQRMRHNVLRRAEKTAGHHKLSQIDSTHIAKAMAGKRPHAANTFRKIMNQLFKFGVKAGYLKTNPVDGVDALRIKTDGHHTWTKEEVRRFWHYWPVGTKQRLALDLLLFTGLRRSDIIRLGRQHIHGNTIQIKTEKTGAWLALPISTFLKASIDATQTGDLIFLTTVHGKPFSSPASFGNWFARACVEAGCPGRAHGLRKAGATIAAEGGATASQLMAMFTWTKLDEAELYTRKAQRAVLARGALERIENGISPNLDPDSPNPENLLMKTKGKK